MKKRLMILLLGAVMMLTLGGYAYAEDLTGFELGQTDAYLAEEGENEYPYYEISDILYDKDSKTGKEYKSGFIYNDKWLLESPTEVSGDMAKVSAMLSMAAYNTGYVKNMLEQMEYSVIDQYDYQPKSYDESDSVAFTVGEKEIGGRKVYCIAIRGTGGESGAWASDFHLGNPTQNGGNHEGFYNAADRMQARLETLLDLSDGAILWFTGHSRGAAVANIMAARYTEYIGRGRVFAYTFACPAVSKHAVTDGYENIFNFNNAGDAIPAMPLYEWGYRRYGITFEFGVQDDPAFEMQYLAAESGQNASASNTMHYEDIMRALFPTESDVDSPLGRFLTGLLSVFMPGSDNDFVNVVGYVGTGVLTNELLYRATATNSVYEFYHYLSNTLPKLSTYSSYLGAALIQINQAEAEETDENRGSAMQAWLSNNATQIREIYEVTGIMIESKQDMLDVIDLCNKQLSKDIPVSRVLQSIAAVIDLISDGNGSALGRLADGHKGPTYVLGINSKFFGYEAYKGFPMEEAVIPTELMARFPDAVFPVSVKTVGTRCFNGSTVITLENTEGLEYLGAEAFNGASRLDGIRLRAVKDILDHAFYGCSSLQNVELENVETIGSYAFSYCGTEAEMTVNFITSGVSIGYHAFSYCGTAEMPMSISFAAESSYGWGIIDWSSVKTITLPTDFAAGVAEDVYALGGPNMIQKLIVRPVGDGVMVDHETAYQGFGDNVIEAEFEEGVVHIGAHLLESSSFYGGPLQKVVLPSSLQSVGERAFCFQVEMTTEFPHGLKHVGEAAFANCSSLKSVDLRNAETIGDDAFCGCSSLQSVDLRNVETIASGAFYGCSSLQNVELEKVKTIGSDAFSYCGSVKTPMSINFVAECSYGEEILDQSTIETLTIPTDFVADVAYNIETLGRPYKIQKLIVRPVGDGVMVDHETAYRGLGDSVIEAEFEEGVVHIGAYLLSTYSYGTPTVQRVTLPSSLQSVGECAFSGQEKLTTIEFPEGLKHIGDQAFYACLGLQDVNLKNVKSIGSAFFECSNLQNVESKNLETIGDDAFSGCSSLQSVDLRNAETIGDYAFSGCSSLQSVDLRNVETIAIGAFSGCSSLQSVDLRNVETIASGAFRRCSSLQNVELEKVKSIGSDAFSYCGTAVTPMSITFVAECSYGEVILDQSTIKTLTIPTDFAAGVTESVNALGGPVTIQKLIVRSVGNGVMPDNKKMAYKGLGDSVIEAEFEEGVVHIGAYLLSSSDSSTPTVQKVTLPSSLQSVGDSAFSGQEKLTDIFYHDDQEAWGAVTLAEGNSPLLNACLHYASVELTPDFTTPAALLMIEDEAFRGCAFSYVKLGEHVTDIGAFAFADSPNLKYILIPATVTSIGTDAFKDTAPGFTILTPAGSFAESYARDNNIRFGVINDAA